MPIVDRSRRQRRDDRLDAPEDDDAAIEEARQRPDREEHSARTSPRRHAARCQGEYRPTVTDTGVPPRVDKEVARDAADHGHHRADHRSSRLPAPTASAPWPAWRANTRRRSDQHGRGEAARMDDLVGNRRPRTARRRLAGRHSGAADRQIGARQRAAPARRRLVRHAPPRRATRSPVDVNRCQGSFRRCWSR